MMAKEVGLRGRMDISSFNENVQSFMKSISGMNAEVARVAKESTAGAKAAGESAGLLGVNWQRVKDIVTGLFVIDVFRQISRGLKSVIADAFDATAVFQSLMITLGAILARDFAKEFGVPVAQALAQISDKAQELLGWVRQIAVTTPFSVESIAQALAYGQAFGFNVEQSKRLTLATGDFVAGMGLTDEHMRRIIYNFGQMLASGRVLGRELRDLANNFVPIRDITQYLADEAGIPFEEMKKAMSEARVSAEQFIGAFVTLAERDFTGAMRRMARTIRGVQQNISDFIRTLFGLELLGPVMERIAGLAADALDAAFSPETIRSFAIMGQVLLVVFEKIYFAIAKLLIPEINKFFQALGFGTPTVLKLASAILHVTYIIATLIRALSKGISSITDWINAISDRFNVTFAELVKNAASWGYNIIVSLAAGMAKAVAFIIQVLNAIAQVFTQWLGARSAPKLLPDLPKWGKAAMEAYLKGWSSADFGLFSDIANVITQFIRSIAHTIPEADLIPRILGARAAIQRAVNDIKKFGEVTEGSLNKILKALKITSGPLKNFIRETFEFAKVSAMIEAAKKLLDFDIKFDIPTKILGQTIVYLSDLVKLATRFKGALGDALRDYVDALEDTRLANERVALAQKSLNDMTEKYDKQLKALRRLQDQLRQKEDFSGRLKDIEAAVVSGLLTDEEKRRLELEKEGVLLEHKIVALENERDVAVDSARERLEAEQAIADVAEYRLERQRRLATQLADEQLAAAQEQLDAARALVEMQIESNNLLQEQVELLKRLAAAAAGAGVEGFEIPGLDFEGFVDELENTLLESKEAIAQAIADLRNEVTKHIRKFINAITAPFEGIPEKLRQLLADIGNVFEEAQKNVAIQRFAVSLYVFQDRIQQSLRNLRTFWEQNGPGILEIVGNFFDRLSEVIKPELANILVSIGLGIEQFGKFLVDLSERLVESGPQIQESLQGWVDWVFDKGIPRLVEFGRSLKENVIPAIKDFAGIVKDNAPTIIAILTALTGAFLSIRPALVVFSALSKIGLALIPLQIVFNTLSGVAGTLAKVFGTIAGVIGPVLGKIAAIVGASLGPIILIVLALIGVFLALKDDVLGLRTTLVNAFKAIGKAIEPAIGPLKEAFAKLMPVLKKLLTSLAPVGRVLIGILKLIGTIILSVVVPVIVGLLGLITGLIRGLITGFTYFLNGIRLVAEGVTRFIDGIVNIVQGLITLVTGIFTGSGEKIKEGLDQIFRGVLGVLSGILETIVGVVATAIGSVVGTFEGFLTGIFDFFANLFGLSNVSETLNEVSEKFSTFFSDIIDSISTWVSNAIQTIRDFRDDLVVAGTEFVQNLIDGIREKIFGETGLIARVKFWIEMTITKAKLLYYKYKVLGQEFIDRLLEGIQEKFESVGGVYAKFKEFIQNTLDKIEDIKDAILQAGRNLIAGLIEGIVQKAEDLYATVKTVIKTALGIAEKESEVESESKVMRRLGEYWMSGLQQGILDEAVSVQNTLASVFSDLMAVPKNMQFDLEKLASDVSSLGDFGGGLDVRHLLQPSAGGADRLLTQPAPSQTNIQHLNIEVNPTYTEVQSEASIYYDVRAALAHITR